MLFFNCKQSLDPEFLYMALKTPLFNRVIRENTTGSVRQNLSFEVLSTLPIPLPTMAEQQALVEAYNSKIKAAEEKERRAVQLNKEIEDYLLSELGIKKQQHTDKADLLLKFVRFKGVEEWGYDKIIGSNFGLLKSNLYDNKKLNELLEINPSTSFLSLNDNDELSFIPMECISDEFGEWKERRKCKKKDSKGYTKFQSGDLIWARITPCMQNGKSAIVDNLESGLGCGSTEFHVLRNKESGLNLQFVHLILRQPMVLDDAKRSFTGSAGQQRVPKSYLENLSIPFPPISIQNAIVEHANQLKEQMKQLKQEAKELRENALVEFEKEIFEN